MQNRYDIAFVGAGISAAYTLIHYISELEKQPANQPRRILALEKTGEFWTGVPYGQQSGNNPLIITAVKEFIPQQPERDHFIDWLKKNRNWFFENIEQKEGILSGKWHEEHRDALANGDWDDLFIPRYIFGLYIKAYVNEISDKAIEGGLIELSLKKGTVMDVQSFENQYEIQFQDASGSLFKIVTQKLVLAMGSPPNVGLGQSITNVEKSDTAYFTNIYEPSLDTNLTLICEELQKIDDPERRQVLIIGSNAGTLDTLYTLNNLPQAKGLIHKFIVLSPNGAFPHRITREKFQHNYVPQCLNDLAQQSSFTAKQILEAVQQDVAVASDRNLNIADIFPDISRSMINALDLLGEEEQRRFVATYAIEIGKLQRRAGWEYLEVVDGLVAEGRLEFLKGRFITYLSVENGGPGVEYMAGNPPEKKRLTESIGLVISCAGFQEVTTSSSELIQNLIRRKICIPNESKRGFVLNENFETAKNCYLMGPLVAGNLNKSLRVWHAESCSRIIHMSKKLAEVLVRNS